MAASRTMTAIVARSLNGVAEQITVPQLRVLVLLSARGPMNLSAVARHLDVNPSNASRTCDQLVASGRVSREPDAQDRRLTVLRLTPDGTRFVEGILTARRRLFEEVVSQMSADDQAFLARGLEAFLAVVATTLGEDSVDLPNGQLIPWVM